MDKIAVIGSGNAGFALACHLSLNGHQVALFAHPRYIKSIEAVKREGIIYGSPEEDGCKAAVSGIGEIVLATTNIAEAVNFSKIIFMVLPLYGQVPMFELMLPYLRNGQIIVSMPGNFAALEYSRIMEQKGSGQDIAFVDTDSTLYACQKLKQPDNGVFISGIKIGLTIGVHPHEKTNNVAALLSDIIPCALYGAIDVIEPAFGNLDISFHPVPAILNYGWAEATDGDFKFYTDGCSPSICRVIESVDKERMTIAEALGVTTSDFVSIFERWYGDKGFSNVYDVLHNSDCHRYFKPPSSLADHYIIEDLCYNLMPIAQEGNKRGVATPAIDSLVHIASILMGEPIVPKRSLAFIFKDERIVEEDKLL